MRKLTLPIIALLCVLPSLLMGQVVNQNYKPLLESAQKFNSDALIVLEDGNKVVEYYSDSESKKIQSMSVTKSIVGLAFAKLLTDGKIDSLSTPVAHYYPEWRQGQKKIITVRHLLNHTSGLQNVDNANIEVNPAADKIQLGLCASVVNDPGSTFSYNNKAVNILSGIFKKVASEPIDDYLQKNIFNEMNISDYQWATDEEGNHVAMSGLQMHGYDLAKIGQLVLQKGAWNGNQLIDKQWIDRMLNDTPSNTTEYGLLWWRIQKNRKFVISDEQISDMKEANVPENFITKMENIKGEYHSQGGVVDAIRSQFENRKQLVQFRRATLGQDIAPYSKSINGPTIGYKAAGDLGQYIVIYPNKNVVAVRMVQRTEDFDPKTDYFDTFPRMVYKLAPEN